MQGLMPSSIPRNVATFQWRWLLWRWCRNDSAQVNTLIFPDFQRLPCELYPFASPPEESLCAATGQGGGTYFNRQGMVNMHLSCRPPCSQKPTGVPWLHRTYGPG